MFFFFSIFSIFFYHEKEIKPDKFQNQHRKTKLKYVKNCIFKLYNT